MKRTFFTKLIASTLIMVGLSACTKDSSSSITQTQTGSPSPVQTTTIELVADQWVNYGDGVYINDFQNILSRLNMPTGNHLSIYVLDNDVAKYDHSTIINRTPIMFKGHELWAVTTATDIILNYRCADEPIPFRALHIKVVAN